MPEGVDPQKDNSEEDTYGELLVTMDVAINPHGQHVVIATGVGLHHFGVGLDSCCANKG